MQEKIFLNDREKCFCFTIAKDFESESLVKIQFCMNLFDVYYHLKKSENIPVQEAPL